VGSRAGAIAANTVTNYLRYAVHIGLVVVLLPFTLLKLGTEAYGLWALAISLLGLFGFLDFGFSTSVVKYVAQYRGTGDDDGLGRLSATLQTVFWSLGLVVAAGTTVLAWRFTTWFDVAETVRADAGWVIFFLGLRTALNFPFSFYRGVLFGYHRMALVNGFKMAELVVNGLATVWLLSSGYGLRALALATFAVSFVHYTGLAGYTLYAHPTVRFRRRAVRRELLTEVTSFSFYAFLVNVGVLIITRTDLLVIKYYMPLSAIAVYTIGLKLCDYTTGFCKQFVNTLTPVVAELRGAEDGEALKAVYLKGTRFTLLIAIPIVLCLVWFAPAIIVRWIGPGFDEAVPVARLLLMTSLVTLVQSVGSNVLAMTGRHRTTALATLGSACVNVALSMVLAVPLGLFGVALATLVTAAVVDLGITLPLALGHAGVDRRTFVTRALAPAVVPTVALVVALQGLSTVLPPSSLPVIAVDCAFAGLCFAVVAWRSSLTSSERATYGTRITRLIERLAGPGAAAAVAVPLGVPSGGTP